MYSPSQYAPSSRHTRHRSQNYTWDHTYFYHSETRLTPSPTSSVVANHHSPPTSIHTPPSPVSPAATLPSRINALNRRAAIVSANLAHLTAVAKPLETTALDALSDDLLSDMWEEGQGLGKAMEAFKEQMEEVSELLQELLLRKKEVWKKGEARRRGKSRGGELEY